MAISNKTADDIFDLINDVDAFYNEETDPDLEGKLVSITTMILARRETSVAVIVLTAPLKAVKGSKDEKQTVDLEPGQAVGVVVKHKLQDLFSMLDNQCWVQIRAKEKVELDNGNEMWKYAIRFRGRRTGLATPRTPTADRPAPSASKSKDPEGDAKRSLDSY